MSTILELRQRDDEIKLIVTSMMQELEETFACDVKSFNLVLEVEGGHCVIHHGTISVMK